jgi:SAM-dependent methyltransferase
MKAEDNPKNIKYYIKRFLLDRTDEFKNKKIVDFPAGAGVTSRILKEIGANPIAMDLFPEYFDIDGLNCTRANINDGLPLENQSVDGVICQEGIEHFSDQIFALKEFNRVIKKGGTLIITTPNYSNIRAKLSYLLSESERYNDLMPPNELDSIWLNEQNLTKEIYYGHIFLIGVQKLRTLAKLSGFDIKAYHPTNIKPTSTLFFPFIYPFIYLSNLYTYRKNLKKNTLYSKEVKKTVYKEIFNLAVNPRILISGNLMFEFVKTMEHTEVAKDLVSKYPAKNKRNTK